MFPIFQSRKTFFQGTSGRVVRTRIFVALMSARGALHIGRGLVNRRHDRAGMRVWLYAGMDGLGSEFHLGSFIRIEFPLKWPRHTYL